MPHPWFLEKHTPDTGLTFSVKDKLFDRSSAFQKIEVLDTEAYGRVLVLDGCVMLTDRDEFIYHEMIVHPPLLCHGRPERVLVVGGGDGGSVREVLRHPSVTSVHLVEIDAMVVEVAREFFPALSAGLDDPRVEVVVADGFDHLAANPGAYDAILVDSIDPVGEAAKLFTGDFYQLAKAGLRAGGVLTCQTESPFISGPVLGRVFHALKEHFAHVAPYLAFIPTYPAGMWSFHFASDAADPRAVNPDWGAGFLDGLKYLTPEVFRAAFALPAFVQAYLAAPPAR